MKKIIVMVAFSLLLGGCSGISLTSSTPAVSYYTLHAAAAPSAIPARAVVAIAEPDVPPGFEGDHIVLYLQQGHRLDYAATAAWPGPFPKVLQDFIIQSGNAIPGMMATTLDSGLPVHYKLGIRVNDFEPVYGASAKAPPLLRASMTFTLQPLDRNRISARFTLSEEKPASANTLTAITSGLQSMAQEMAAQAFAKISPRLGRG